MNHPLRWTERVDPVTDADPTATGLKDASRAVSVRCWGVRGSIPSPGPQTIRHGGNTTCVEYRFGESRLVFDAGSGLRPLGLELVASGPDTTTIFLTHFHWDHIQGFPFFAPLYDSEDTLRIIGPKQNNIDVRNLFAGQMGPIYFPVPFSVVAATMDFEELREDPYSVDGVTIRSFQVRHPSNVVAYRIEAGGRTVCFVPDNELEGGMYGLGQDWERGFRAFLEGADLLIHDAMYTDEEYPQRSGWGHSTYSQALRIAEESGVDQLLFFHHDPTRSDDALDEIVNRIRDDALAKGCRVKMRAAREDEDILLEEPR